MNEADFKRRTMQFGLDVLGLVEALPSTPTARAIGNQLLRSGTSVGANYRAACRAQSLPDILRKLSIVEEEADESGYWLEIVQARRLADPQLAAGLLREASEITAMVVASKKTLKARGGRSGWGGPRPIGNRTG